MVNFQFHGDEEEILELLRNFSGSAKGALSGGILAVLFSMLMFAFLIGVAVSLVLWALESIGICVMSEKEGLKNPWYSFIPFFSAFALGRLGAGFKKKNGSVTKNRGKLLLTLNIVLAASLVLIMLVVFAGIIPIAVSDALGYQLTGPLIALLSICLILYLAVFALAVVYLVFTYISVYNIFLKFNNQMAVCFTVLSIVFPILMPIFLFVSRNKAPVHSVDELNGQFYVNQ